MDTHKHVFQISGIKNREKKRVLVQGIQQLGGKYLGGSVSRDPLKNILGEMTDALQVEMFGQTVLQLTRNFNFNLRKLGKK